MMFAKIQVHPLVYQSMFKAISATIKIAKEMPTTTPLPMRLARPARSSLTTAGAASSVRGAVASCRSRIAQGTGHHQMVKSWNGRKAGMGWNGGMLVSGDVEVWEFMTRWSRVFSVRRCSASLLASLRSTSSSWSPQKSRSLAQPTPTTCRSQRRRLTGPNRPSF